MKLNSLQHSKGFTLVEILIVVIIVGLLSGIAVSKLGDSKERAVQSVKKSAAAELNKAIQIAYIKGNIIPAFTGSNNVNEIISASATDAHGIDSLIIQLQGFGTFTASSAEEMKHGITDTTPNGGFLTATTGAGDINHMNLEVVYNIGTYIGGPL